MAASARSIYRVSKSIHVSDVDEKFKKRDVVQSCEFFSVQDPLPTSFKISIEFGDESDPNHLSVAISYPRTGARAVNEKLKIYNDTGICVANDNGHHQYAMYWFVGIQYTRYSQENILEDKSKVNWEFVYTLEYENDDYWLKITLPMPGLQRDFKKLLDDERHADVTFIVQGHRIKAHRLILTTRCSYFEKMFQADMIESRSNEVEVPDIRPAVFNQLLRYLYTDEPPTYSDMTAEILVAADKYEIEPLKTICSNSLRSHLDRNNVIKLMILAESLSLPCLAEDALLMFKKNVAHLRGCSEWKSLAAYPELLLRVLGSSYD